MLTDLFENLNSSLEDEILKSKAIETEKRTVIMEKITIDPDSYEHNDGDEDCDEGMKDRCSDSSDYISDGVDAGAEIGGILLGIPGAIAGAFLGGFAGCVKSILDDMFEN